MEFSQLVKENRSCRSFDRRRKITEEELLELIDLTRYTASTCNRQVLRFRPVCLENEVEAVQAHTGWAAELSELHLPYPGTEPAAFIAICFDRESVGTSNSYLRDLGIAAQTILLAATEKGLGGCMLGSFDRKRVTEILKLPESAAPQLLVALGKPMEERHIVEMPESGSTDCFRDASGKIHYVPKRKLKDILL